MESPDKQTIGLIAGNGRFPLLFAEAARAQGLTVEAIAHRGETDPALEPLVHSMTWVRVGQLDGIIRALRRRGVRRAVMAGGIGRVRALTEARPDLGAFKLISRLRSLRDDGFLRAVADYFQAREIEIVAPTAYVPSLLAPEGHLAGPALNDGQRNDVRLGQEVGAILGKADVGQTVVVRLGHVLAVEALEGTDEAIRRGGRLGGKGAVVVKRAKPGQDERFDLPAVGLKTLAVMREVQANVLALEPGRTVLLDGAEFFQQAERDGISVIGVPAMDAPHVRSR